MFESIGVVRVAQETAFALQIAVSALFDNAGVSATEGSRYRKSLQIIVPIVVTDMNAPACRAFFHDGLLRIIGSGSFRPRNHRPELILGFYGDFFFPGRIGTTETIFRASILP